MQQPTKKSKPNKNILILAFIMVINALSYGVIIPLLYPYAEKFGINAFGISLLFTSYSIAQFFATPVLGRLSDRWGRRPMMFFSVVGTAVSLALFASATTVPMLFFARLIDGITGGNISIAQAIISDSTKPEERAKYFGMVMGSFGFGFLVGPAIGGLLTNYGITTPFWFAAGLALIGALVVAVMLPETLDKKTMNRQNHEPLFKFNSLYEALFNPYTGVLIVMSFLSAVGLNAFYVGFQTFTVDVLKLNTVMIGIFFSSFGLINLLMQMFAVGTVLKYFGSQKKVLIFSLASTVACMVGAFFTRSVWPFFGVMAILGIVGAFRDPVLTALLSERTRHEDQGTIMGINQSYIALGQIFGPLAAGLISIHSVPAIFLAAAGIYSVAILASKWLYIKHKPVDL
jgi:MFS family permease